MNVSVPAALWTGSSGQTAASEKHQNEAALRPENHPGGLAHRLSFTRHTLPRKFLQKSPQQELTAVMLSPFKHPAAAVWQQSDGTSSIFGKEYLYFMK